MIFLKSTYSVTQPRLLWKFAQTLKKLIQQLNGEKTEYYKKIIDK